MENRKSHEKDSFLFCNPVKDIICHAEEEIVRCLTEIDQERQKGFYLVGYISYEAGCILNEVQLSAERKSNLSLPFLHFIAFKERVAMSQSEVNAMLAQKPQEPEVYIANLKLNISEEEYADKLKLIKKHLVEGDTYQVNFTAQYHFEYPGSPLTLYAVLRDRQKVEYSAFLDYGDYQILSLSPELFFKKEGRKLTAKPMKGTMPRSPDIEIDQNNKAFLLADAKSRAENLMIVDLLRNDLSKLCAVNTLHVPQILNVESYETVHQMVSEISCDLEEGGSKNAFSDIVQNLFPCGSITGVPKKKTMEIIQALEKESRGIYTGAIGYIAPDEDMCFSVAIRTLFLTGGLGKLGVGGGIVIDSDTKREYEEMKLKSKFLTGLLPHFNLVETMRFDKGSGFFNLDRHLARLSLSAHYFGLKCQGEKIKTSLQNQAGEIEDDSFYRFRIELDPSGDFVVAYQKVDSQYLKNDLPVMLCEEPLDMDFALSRHKTTARSTRGKYNDRYQAFLKNHPALFDVIFFNSRGHITEGSKSNVFIRQGTQWVTPGKNAAFLPGIMRQVFLENNRVIEAEVSIKDFLGAEEIVLTNSIIGFKRVKLINEKNINYR